MIRGFLNLPWFVWAAVALLVAILYSFVWPRDRIAELSSFRFLVLRWGHALTWLLISVNFILRGIDPKYNEVANLIAAAGGFTYLLFIVMTFAAK
jgi:hypothetical protein